MRDEEVDGATGVCVGVHRRTRWSATRTGRRWKREGRLDPGGATRGGEDGKTADLVSPTGEEVKVRPKCCEQRLTPVEGLVVGQGREGRGYGVGGGVSLERRSGGDRGTGE